MTEPMMSTSASDGASIAANGVTGELALPAATVKKEPRSFKREVSWQAQTIDATAVQRTLTRLWNEVIDERRAVAGKPKRDGDAVIDAHPDHKSHRHRRYRGGCRTTAWHGDITRRVLSFPLGNSGAHAAHDAFRQRSRDQAWRSRSFLPRTGKHRCVSRRSRSRRLVEKHCWRASHLRSFSPSCRIVLVSQRHLRREPAAARGDRLRRSLYRRFQPGGRSIEGAPVSGGA